MDKIDILEQKILNYIVKEPQIKELDQLLLFIKQVKTKYDVATEVLEKILTVFKKKQKSFSHVYSSAHLLSALFLKGIINIEDLKIDKILDLINILANFVKVLEGIPISFYIAHYMLQIINFILESDEYKLEEEQKKVLKDFQEDPKIKNQGIQENKEFEKKLTEIEELCADEDTDKKQEGINKLADIYTQCQNYEEQIQLFIGKGTEIVKKLVANLKINDETKKDKVKNVLLSLGKIMETLMVKTEFMIEFQREKLKESRDKCVAGKQLEQFIVNKEDAKDEKEYEEKRSQNKIENDSVILTYRQVNHEIVLRKTEDIYPSVALIINSMLLFPQSLEMMQYCLNTLAVMLKMFPQYRDHIEAPMLTVLQNYNEFQDEENKKKAAMQAYIMLNDEIPSWRVRDAFNTWEKLSSLTSSKYYSKDYFSKTSFQNPELHRFDQLLIRSSFSLEKIVKPETGYCHYIEVKRPFSILYCGFATYQNDIRVRVSKVLDFEDFEDNKTLPRYYYEQKLNAEMEPYKILLLVEKPGVFKIEFDNTYSWINEKQVRFRHSVLEPDEQDSEIRKELEMFAPTEEEIKKDTKDVLRRFKEGLEKVKIQMIYRPNVIEFKLKYKDKLFQEQIDIDREKVMESLEGANEKIVKYIEEQVGEDVSKIKSYCNFIFNRELSDEIKDNIQRTLSYKEKDLIQQIFQFFHNFWDSTIYPTDENYVFFDTFIAQNYESHKEKSFIILKVNFKHKLMSAVCFKDGKLFNTKDFSLLMACPGTAYKKAFFLKKSDEFGEKIIANMIINAIKLSRKENKFDHIILWEEEHDSYYKDKEENINNFKKAINDTITQYQLSEINIDYIRKNVADLGINIEQTKDSDDEDPEKEKTKEEIQKEKEEKEKLEKEAKEKEEKERLAKLQKIKDKEEKSDYEDSQDSQDEENQDQI